MNFCKKLFKKDEILQEGHFARKEFGEKGILGEESNSRIWRMNRLIDSPNPWIKIDWFMSQAIGRILCSFGYFSNQIYSTVV